jgi:hypothetical protein
MGGYRAVCNYSRKGKIAATGYQAMNLFPHRKNGKSLAPIPNELPN